MNQTSSLSDVVCNNLNNDAWVLIIIEIVRSHIDSPEFSNYDWESFLISFYRTDKHPGKIIWEFLCVHCGRYRERTIQCPVTSGTLNVPATIKKLYDLHFHGIVPYLKQLAPKINLKQLLLNGSHRFEGARSVLYTQCLADADQEEIMAVLNGQCQRLNRTLDDIFVLERDLLKMRWIIKYPDLVAKLLAQHYYPGEHSDTFTPDDKLCPHVTPRRSCVCRCVTPSNDQWINCVMFGVQIVFNFNSPKKCTCLASVYENDKTKRYRDRKHYRKHGCCKPRPTVFRVACWMYAKEEDATIKERIRTSICLMLNSGHINVLRAGTHRCSALSDIYSSGDGELFSLLMQHVHLTETFREAIYFVAKKCKEKNDVETYRRILTRTNPTISNYGDVNDFDTPLHPSHNDLPSLSWPLHYALVDRKTQRKIRQMFIARSVGYSALPNEILFNIASYL
jgi:hypothetical protein